MTSTLIRRSRFLAIAVAVAAAGALPASSSAGVLVESAAECAEQPLSKPFLPWLDVADYTPAPNGTFEAGASGWALDDAQVVDGNEPFNVARDDGTRSLRIAPGGSAVTSTMCVGLAHPTLRLVAKRSGGGLLGVLSSLRVDVLYENRLGLLEALPVGTILGSTSWAPTAPQLVVANLLPLLPGARTPVAFRFTAQGTSSWHLDDVFVDPWAGR